MIRVLFVCTGNICRSPMAEGILRKRLRETGRHAEIVVESAGTFPVEGAPASREAVEIAAQEKIDLRGHVSRGVTPRTIARADLVLVMEPSHRDRIVEAYPEAAEKTHLLTTYAAAGGDVRGIADPIGLGREFYRETFQRLQESIDLALAKIVSAGEGETETGASRDGG